MPKYLILSFLFFIDLVYSDTICKPTDTGNGVICMTDEQVGDLSGAGPITDMPASASSTATIKQNDLSKSKK